MFAASQAGTRIVSDGEGRGVSGYVALLDWGWRTLLLVYELSAVSYGRSLEKRLCKRDG